MDVLAEGLLGDIFHGVTRSFLGGTDSAFESGGSGCRVPEFPDSTPATLRHLAVTAEDMSVLDTELGRICMEAKHRYMSGQKKAATTENTRPAKVGPIIQER